MLNGERVFAVIPARGGSKSIVRKNLYPLGGRPLITWSIDVAREVAEIDRILVSTDDPEIASTANHAGAEVYMRPAHLATDDALVIDALRDLLESLRGEGDPPEWMVLLEPTCPLRRAEDVRACFALARERHYDSIATFKEAELNPHRAWRLVAGEPEVFIPGAVPWMPRQSLPPAYQLNGAVYLFRTQVLRPGSPSLLAGKTGAVLMPRERSQDIDEPLDLAIVETLLNYPRL
jgi:CMP-N-acetylneuraminic acid synthetase